MLRFAAYRDGQGVRNIDLAGAYMYGSDGVPVRADLVAAGHLVTCMKRTSGACALCVLWPAGKAGKMLLPTTRLPESPKPYNLNLELARAQIMRLYQRREEWAVFDLYGAEEIHREFNAIRGQFVEALKADIKDPPGAARIADETLEQALVFGEKMCLFHADAMAHRRSLAGETPPRMGGQVDLHIDNDAYRRRLSHAFDFVYLPISWRELEPKERVYEQDTLDTWINWAGREQLKVHLGPLLSFQPEYLPDWLYLWESDYNTLKNLIYGHIRRIVQRYRDQVNVWVVGSGLHSINTFNLSFDQIMELTRASCQLVKRLAPDSEVVIDLPMPWGEHYARNIRTIPPMRYADMAFQNNYAFDGFGIHLTMGIARDGYFLRDFLQVCGLLDAFQLYDKNMYITACQVPSSIEPDPTDIWAGQCDVAQGGIWHNGWSERLQAEWLQALLRMALARPFVQSVCWHDLADLPGHFLPHGGLLRRDLHPKMAYQELIHFRSSLAERFTASVEEGSAGASA